MKRLPALWSWSWWTGSISRRIGLAALAVVILTAIVAAISLRGIAVLSGQLDSAVAEQAKATQLVTKMLAESQNLSDSVRTAAMAPTPEERAAALVQMEAAKKSLGASVDQISAQLTHAPELQVALQEGYSSFVISAVKASRLIQAQRQADAEHELFARFDPKLLAYLLTTVAAISEDTQRSMSQVAESGQQVYSRTIVLLAATLLAVAISVAVGHWLLRRIVIRPVQRAARAAEQLAAGQFDVDLSTDNADECGEMLQAMAQLRELGIAS